jgi:ferric-dicitrate binding protein FerR (iron transport regulator)
VQPARQVLCQTECSEQTAEKEIRMSPNDAVSFALLMAGAIALFSFLAVAKWSDNRRREREAYYKSETIRKVMEMPGATPATVQEFIREQQAIADQRRREVLKLGGMITIAAGLGIIVFLIGKPGPQIYTVGAIPLLVGGALFAYGSSGARRA